MVFQPIFLLTLCVYIAVSSFIFGGGHDVAFVSMFAILYGNIIANWHEYKECQKLLIKIKLKAFESERYKDLPVHMPPATGAQTFPGLHVPWLSKSSGSLPFTVHARIR